MSIINFLDMDTATALGVLASVQGSRFIRAARYRPGDKLKILLVGYNGARNTGADVRVAAMVEQFYRLFGKNQIDLGALTLNVPNFEIYFQAPTRVIPFSSIFFKDVAKQVSEHHLIVLSEGSTLKSKFANALTLFFCEAAGIAKTQGKPCIAYGSEAGDMDPVVEKVAKLTCDQTYFIARTEPSLEIIRRLGLKGHVGTDTAWTFPPGSVKWAKTELRDKAGWDGKKPLVGVAVINPFYWPVKPSLAKLARAAATKNWEMHYQKWYFFSWDEQRRARFEHYIHSIASAVDRFCQEHDAHPVIIGMEALDYDAICLLRDRLKTRTEVFSSRYYDGYQLNAILRMLSMLITSRYHARVLSMPPGVPSIAVSMDERLYNLCQESGHLEDYYFEVDAPRLGSDLLAAMEKMWDNRDAVKGQILATVPRYLKIMADMGKFLREFVAEKFPEFPLKEEPEDWKGYLPPLYPELERVLKEYSA